jgi:CheY-like chemotaxis protein
MGKKVLVVDDQEVNRELLKTYLSKSDYEISEASDGLEALDRLHENNFDLLICDILMPHMDGWEVLKKLRSDGKRKSIPVIVLTAKDEDADMFKGYDLGANYYLTKPFTKAQLLYGVSLMFEDTKKK